MSQAKICPKCGREMKEGECLVNRTWPLDMPVEVVEKGARYDDRSARDKAVPFYCPNCGYVELWMRKYAQSEETQGRSRRTETIQQDEEIDSRILGLLENLPEWKKKE